MDEKGNSLGECISYHAFEVILAKPQVDLPQVVAPKLMLWRPIQPSMAPGGLPTPEVANAALVLRAALQRRLRARIAGETRADVP